MKIGVIAEGHSDRYVIRSLLKMLKDIDGSDIISIRPKEDETDKRSFSNWTIVLDECKNRETFKDFFDRVGFIDEERYMVIQIDTAERGEKGYDVHSPSRSGRIDWQTYSNELRCDVIKKLQDLIPPAYHNKILYAVCIEETDAWLIPIWKKEGVDSAKYVKPKEELQTLVSNLSQKEQNKYVDTQAKHLNYENIAKQLKKQILKECRQQNKSLDSFCSDVEKMLCP
ncbi:hypothetical protein EZS27_024387 [termite gut metagenome]|uniref:Uncharacterized protein n=1 Tax=termite gut metagenome TaxID=433724 RepID=A0A5J4QZ46_9ZZZZ